MQKYMRLALRWQHQKEFETMEGLRVCFIGHRKILMTDELKASILNAIEDLIVKEKATYFLFGSRSQFDDLCHDIVSELQQKYPCIVRVAYTCRSEAAIMKEDKKREEEIWKNLLHKDVQIKDFDAEYEHPAKYTSGRGSYVERNQAMIDDSDICIFYYDENYLPPRRKNSPMDISDYQPKSGTAIAYNYAIKKEKRTINVQKSISKNSAD